MRTALDRNGRTALRLVCVGGSAGSLEPLCTLVAALGGVHLPIAIVIHIPRHRPSSLHEVIAHKAGRDVVEPDDKEPITEEMVYLAPPDYHLMVDTGPCFSLSVDEPVNLSLPAIDVLFESSARTLGAGVVGVVLSGANADGALGLATIARAGGLAFVQEPETAAYPTMPIAALSATPAALALPIEGIARRVRDACGIEGRR